MPERDEILSLGFAQDPEVDRVGQARLFLRSLRRFDWLRRGERR
jgi:hypothetical protein